VTTHWRTARADEHIRPRRIDRRHSAPHRGLSAARAGARAWESAAADSPDPRRRTRAHSWHSAAATALARLQREAPTGHRNDVRAPAPPVGPAIRQQVSLRRSRCRCADRRPPRRATRRVRPPLVVRGAHPRPRARSRAHGTRLPRPAIVR
jgi:hypothetical protein